MYTGIYGKNGVFILIMVKTKNLITVIIMANLIVSISQMY
jgi:hypothetical protein